MPQENEKLSKEVIENIYVKKIDELNFTIKKELPNTELEGLKIVNLM